jgi:hypothetical protein
LPRRKTGVIDTATHHRPRIGADDAALYGFLENATGTAIRLLHLVQKRGLEVVA